MTASVDVDALLAMSQDELDALFGSIKDIGPIPSGEADGTVIIARDTTVFETAAKVAHLIAWQGKVFDPDKGELLNRIGPFGEHAVRAKVYVANSWFDSQPAIILDYSRTSLVAHWVRDEIREASPGLYLGLVYWKEERLLNFSLRFPSPTAEPTTAEVRSAEFSERSPLQVDMSERTSGKSG